MRALEEDEGFPEGLVHEIGPGDPDARAPGSAVPAPRVAVSAYAARALA